jgi:eukaryotic-like serine/threonine-protein kinase
MSFEPPSDQLILEIFPQIGELALLDKGGFKAVYRARIAGKTEAFKLIQLPRVDETEDAEAFRHEMIGRVRREVEALGQCQVPEIVKLGSVKATGGQIEGWDYVGYSEEFLEGKDLWKLLRSGMPKPEERELRVLFISLLKAIRELWRHGYVHRDIKPLNIMKLAATDRPFVLLDLGIAYSVRETALTVNAAERFPPATYRYLAPEMMTPGFRGNLDYRSDLYSAALTVFEYGAQRHPLARDRDDLMQTISRTLHQPPTPLKQLRPDLSDEFCLMVDQMLKKKPALRPANVNTLINRLGGTR